LKDYSLDAPQSEVFEAFLRFLEGEEEEFLFLHSILLMVAIALEVWTKASLIQVQNSIQMTFCAALVVLFVVVLSVVVVEVKLFCRLKDVLSNLWTFLFLFPFLILLLHRLHLSLKWLCLWLWRLREKQKSDRFHRQE